MFLTSSTGGVWSSNGVAPYCSNLSELTKFVFLFSLIYREGRTKAVGKITKICPHTPFSEHRQKHKMGKGRGQGGGPKPPDNSPSNTGATGGSCGYGSKGGGGRRSRNRKAKEAAAAASAAENVENVEPEKKPSRLTLQRLDLNPPNE